MNDATAYLRELVAKKRQAQRSLMQESAFALVVTGALGFLATGSGWLALLAAAVVFFSRGGNQSAQLASIDVEIDRFLFEHIEELEGAKDVLEADALIADAASKKFRWF